MPYNPFNKPIGSKLTADDLKKLIEQNVAEGYYVEYKSDFPKNEKISRSIASFVNTYGGWYIVGIKTDGHHVANEVCGFSLETHPDPVSKVREIVKSHLDPVPVFYPQVISLENGMSVLAVYIPSGQETPFISKDGRIYRRTHDSSDPIPETSRYTVDQLVNTGRDVVRRFEKFCNDERMFSQSEEKDGWVSLFFSPYPLGTIEKTDILSIESIAHLLHISQSPIKLLNSDSSNLSANLPFNSAQPNYQSVILRQIQPGKVAFNSLMAELFVDGRAKFFIPLRYLTKQDITQIESPQLKEVLRKIRETDKGLSAQYLRFFDIGKLWLAVTCLLNYYQWWIGKEPWLTDLQVVVKGQGLWRSVPFLDSDEWGAHVGKYGLPVVPSDTLRSPPEDKERGLLMSLEANPKLWIRLCYIIGLTFGLPEEIYKTLLSEAITKASNKNIAEADG